MDQETASPEVFTSPAAPEPAPVFGSMAPPPPPQNSDDQIHTTAVLGALAAQRNNPQSQYKTLYELVTDAKSKIMAGQEDQLRADTSNDKKALDIDNIHKQQTELLSNPDYGTEPLKQSLDQEVTLQQQPVDTHALEKEGVAEIQEQASQDKQQALVQHDLITKSPNVVLSIQDNATFMTAWNKAVDSLNQEVQHEGWLHRAVDMFAVLPFQSTYALAKAVPGAQAAIVPGQILANAVDELNHMTLNERLAAIPKVIQNIRQHSGVFSENLELSLSVLQGLMGGNAMDRMGANAMAVNDATSVVGLAKFVTKPFQLAMALGNRAAAVNSVTKDALHAIYNVPEEVGGTGILNGTSWVEATIPSRFKTANLLGPGPGVSGSTAKKLERTQKAVQNFLETSDRNDRVNPAQAQELIQQQAELLDKQLGPDNVLDVSTEGGGATRYSAYGEDLLKTADYRNMLHEGTTAEEFEAIKNSRLKAEQDVDTYAGQRQMKRTFQVEQDEQTGVYQLSAYVGDHQGLGGYRNLEQAKAGIEARGWDPKDVKLIQMPDQSYAIKYTQAVREDQPFTPNMTTTQRPWGRVAMFLKDANDMRDVAFQGPALRALGIQAGLSDKVLRPMIKTLAAVSPQARKHLQTILDMGSMETVPNQSQPGRMYNLSEFIGHYERVSGLPPSQKEITAYYTYKQMRDLEYYLRNRELHIGLERRGIKTISVKHAANGIEIPRQNGREMMSHDLHSDRFLDVDTGKIIPAGHGGEKLQASVKDRLASGNYRIIELQEPHGGESNPVKHILVHKDNSTVGPLDRHQLDYVGGPPIEYKGHYFTKQARSTTVDGEQRWLSPLTHANHATEAEASDYVQRQEAARQAYGKVQDAKNAVKQFPNMRTKAARAARQTLDSVMAEVDPVFKASEAHTYEKFDQLVGAGHISTEYPFEAVYDNGMPQAMNASDARRWFDTEEGSVESLHKTKGRMYYSERGERLSDGNGKLAPVVDPWKATIGSLEQAIKTYAFGDYHQMVMDNWVRLARQSGLIQEEQLKNHSITNVFLNAKIDPKLARATEETQAIASRLENDRELHMRLLGIRTESQTRDNMNARRLAAAIDGHGKLSNKIAAGILDLKSKNPVQAIRAAMYDIGIAAWNVARVTVHGFMSAMAISVHPQYGGQAAVMYPLIRLLGINRDSRVLDFVARHFATDHGFTPESFKSMVTAFNTNNRFYMGDAMEVAESMAGRLGSTRVGQGFSNLRRGGRVFFNEADRMNHIISWQIAWRDALDQPGLQEGTKEFMDYVLRKENVLTGSMSRAGTAAWQKGVLGLPGQFHTLQSRLLERMLPNQFGGNQMLTGAQRMRFYAGGLLLLGAASVPGLPELTDWAAEQYQKAHGQQLTPETWKTISDGLIDGALFGISGGKLDTEWGGRVGIGSFVDDLARNLHGNLLDNIGGATEQYAGRMGGNIIEVAKILAASRSENHDFTSQDFDLIAEDLLKILPAFNNAERGYYIYRYGLIRDPRTNQTIAKVDQLNAMAAVLGVPISSEVEFWKQGASQQQTEQFIHKQAMLAVKLQNDALDALLRGDETAALHYKRLISGMLKAYDGDPLMRNRIGDEMYKIDNKGPVEFEDLLRRMYFRNGEYPLGQGNN